MSDPLNDPYQCGEAYQEAIQKPSKFIWVKIDAEGNYLGHYEWNGHEWTRTEQKEQPHTCKTCQSLALELIQTKLELRLLQDMIKEAAKLP